MSKDMASGGESGDERGETPLVVLDGCGWTWREGELMVSTMGEIETETTSRGNPGRRSNSVTRSIWRSGLILKICRIEGAIDADGGRRNGRKLGEENIEPKSRIDY